mmetsp:Transcript_113414/g.284058  ORF Transcript_113414/g.284058 Transcript_113414/m.284058 type:complete len:207 (+) Transcript_113414:720-1340(+)
MSLSMRAQADQWWLWEMAVARQSGGCEKERWRGLHHHSAAVTAVLPPHLHQRWDRKQGTWLQQLCQKSRSPRWAESYRQTRQILRRSQLRRTMTWILNHVRVRRRKRGENVGGGRGPRGKIHGLGCKRSKRARNRQWTRARRVAIWRNMLPRKHPRWHHHCQHTLAHRAHMLGSHTSKLHRLSARTQALLTWHGMRDRSQSLSLET